MRSIISDLEKKLGFNPDILLDLEGNLNKNFLIVDKNKSFEGLWVLRIPKINLHNKYLEIQKEYQAVGYLINGNEHRFRSIEDQINLIQSAIKANVNVSQVLFYSDNYMVTNFIEGQRYDIFLSQGNDPKIIRAYLLEINKYHNKGLILGDRWGPNTILSQKDFVFFDFDIELLGPYSKEFEISQAIYYSLLKTTKKQKAQEIIKQTFEKFLTKYNSKKIIRYLQGYADYFKDDIQEGFIQKETYSLIELIKNL